MKAGDQIKTAERQDVVLPFSPETSKLEFCRERVSRSI